MTLQIFWALVSERLPPTEDREVLGEDIDQAAVDAPVAGDHPVPRDLLLGHAEVEAAVLHELVQLLEGAVVEEQLHPLAGGELALPVLALAPLGAAPLHGAPDLVPENVDRFRHQRPGHGRRGQRGVRAGCDTAPPCS